jgi:hypothetical protein
VRNLVSVLTVAAASLLTAAAQGQTWTGLNHQPGVPLSLCFLLTDGTVMCQSNRDWYKLSPDIAGSYVNGTWSQLATLPAGYDPNAYASAVLADGRVVLVGGEYTSNGTFVLSNNGAVYDPKTNSWVALPPPPGLLYIGDAPAVVLANGKYLIGSKLDRRMALLDPATLTWTNINPTGKIDGFNSEEGWTLLPDGSVFTLDVKNAPNTERFLPGSSTWVSAGPTPVGLNSPPAEGPIQVAPGVVYVPPGEIGPTLQRPDGTIFAEGASGHTAIFTPPPANSTLPGSWVQGPDFPSGLDAADAPAVLLPNGHVLAAVSPGDSNKGLQFFEFDGSSLIPEPNIPNGSADSTSFTSMLVLPTGQALLADTSQSVEIYTPTGAYNPAWAPTISSVPALLTNGSTYQISGTQFNGLSQGSLYGDELQNATNYPLVRITNNASSHVFYARTHDHSSMGIATGATPVSTSFDVPTNTELGASTLVVVANGIPSLPAAVTVTGSVAPPLNLTCPASTAAVGVSYSSAITVSGGQPPYTYSINGGALPAGLALAATGAITGTPTTVSSASFTANVTDSFLPTPVKTSSSCTITVNPPPLATFLGIDTTTQGSWKGVYGQDGWIIANDSTSLPAYATLNITGASTWSWLPSTTNPIALFKGASSTERIASTYYSGSTFTFDLSLTGGAHQVALYMLDLDTTSRAQTISIIDATTSAVLDSRSFSNFHSGEWAIWSLQGHVLIQVRQTGGLNAVVSGLFFRTQSASIPPPIVSLTAPTAGATLSGTATLSAQAQSAGSIASVQFLLDGANFGSAVSAPGPYSMVWDTTKAANGPHTVAAKATDTQSQSTTSGAVSVTVSNVISGGGTSAAFVRADTATHGYWKGVYGADGSLIANDSSHLPAYAALSAGAAALYTWSGSTADPRALLKYASASDRIASTYYNYPGFSLDLSLLDGQPHQVAFYVLDWDNGGRTQTITIVDASSGALLDSRSAAGFQGGQYFVWTIAGHVQVQFKQVSGQNAVVSGIFFDTSGSTPVPVSVSISAPTAGQSVSGQITLSASAASSAGIASVQFQLDGSNLNPPVTSGSPYQYSLDTSGVANGSHTVKAIATDNANQQATASVTFTVNNASTGGAASATFVKKDVTTKGSWKGVHGKDGEIIANDSNVLPSYVSAAAFNGAAPFTWTITQDPKALQQANGTARTASTFYASPGFTLDLNLADGNAHQVAFYFLDWDGGGRAETITIRDAANQAVLDSQTLSSFQQGAYLVWNIKGHVTVQFTLSAGANAVVGGIFFF